MASNLNASRNANIDRVAAELKIEGAAYIAQLKKFATLDPEVKNNYLQTAIGYNTPFAINWCIAHGADPNHVTALGHTPLWHAVYFYRYTCPDCAMTLVKHGAVFNPKNREHLIFQALEEYKNRSAHPPSTIQAIKRFILDLLNSYSPEILKILRNSIGQTPYVVAKLYGIIDPDILAAITTKTEPKPTNKNIYGRTLANYEALQAMVKKPGGGFRKKTRRNKRIMRKTNRKYRL